MEMAYWICLVVGVGYTIVAFVLGGVAGAIGHVGDAGHGEFTHSYGVQNSGHGHTAGEMADGTGQVIFGPFSPLVVAFFMTCFGGTGVILSQTAVGPFWQIPLSALSGFVLAALLVKFFNRFLGGLQSGSDVKLYTLVGAEAEVTVAIPANGAGEIAYVAMGGRSVSPAYSDNHVEIPRFATVRIARIVGNLFYVHRAVEDAIKDMDTAPVGGTVAGE